MRYLQGLAGLWLLSSAATAIKFVNPSAPGKAKDYSKNPVYVVGSVVELVWADGQKGVKTSVGLWQEDIVNNTGEVKLQIVTENAVDTSSFSWVVATKYDLAVSNVFYLALYEGGGGFADGFSATSHYFNLTQPDSKNTLSATTDTKSTSTTSTTIINSATSTTSTTSTTSSSSSSSAAATAGNGRDAPSPNPANGSSSNANSAPETASTASSSSGLSTAAAIGIGVSIPCALLLGAAAGYLLFRRHRQNTAAATAAAAPPYTSHRVEMTEDRGPLMTPVKYPPAELPEPREIVELPATYR